MMDSKEMLRLFEEVERIRARVEAIDYLILRERAATTIRAILEARSTRS